MRQSVLVAAAMLIALCICTARLPAQDAAAESQVVEAWSDFESVVGCADCHYAGPRTNPFRLGDHRSGEFSRQIELKIWIEQDPHAVTRQRVEPLTSEQQSVGPSNVLSRDICERLGMDVSTDEGYQLFRDNCLTCHGGYVAAQSLAGFDRPAARQPGLSCTACHQAGGQDEWVEAHRTASKWRLLPPDEKTKRGMRHLASATSQAQLCSDCHIGNLSQNKFISHAMYAAGHPPLPSFELATFSDALPRHWRTNAELYASLSAYPQREEYFRRNNPELFSASDTVALADMHWQTRQTLLAAIESRKHVLNLVVDASGTDWWGDYALYDCNACHHELQIPSYRQRSRLDHQVAGVPGRPRQTVWPTVLLDTVARQVDAEQELLAADLELQRAFTTRPFGDAVASQAAAQHVISVLDAMRARLAAIPYDDAMSVDVLRDLAATPAKELYDYHAARQLVWALIQVGREFEQRGRALPGSISSFVRSLEADAPELGISTRLPGAPSSVARDVLADELRLRRNYTPDALLERLRQIQQAADGSNLPALQPFRIETAN